MEQEKKNSLGELMKITMEHIKTMADANTNNRTPSVKLLPVAPPAATTVDRVIETVPEVVDKITGFIESQQQKKAQKEAEGDFVE